jgi:hypothetical protein
MRDCALSGVCLVFYIIWVLYFAYLEPDFSMLRISDSFSPTTVYVSVMLQTPQKRHSKHTDFALVPVHHQWSLERVPIRLEPPQCVSLIASSADDFASGTGSSEILQDALQLVAGGGCFCNLELEFVPLGLVVLLVGAGLILGGMGNRLCVGLLDQGKDACGGLAGGLVEERHDILRAVLQHQSVRALRT